MYIIASLISVNIFVYLSVVTFEIRKHPDTVLAFVGAVLPAIFIYQMLYVVFEKLFSASDKGIIDIVMAILLLPSFMILSKSLLRIKRNMEKYSSKEIIKKSILPLIIVLGYVFVYQIGFLLPFFFICLITAVIVPKKIKEKRRNLFNKNI